MDEPCALRDSRRNCRPLDPEYVLPGSAITVARMKTLAPSSSCRCEMALGSVYTDSWGYMKS
jgi:hypothetical protein